MSKRILMALICAMSGMVMPHLALAQGETGFWRFEVLLNGHAIGEHRYTLKPHGELLAVESRANMQVKFLFFEAYRYEHQADELWRGDCLVSLTSETDNNNEQLVVNASQEQDSFTVSATNNELTLDGCIRSFAYWDPLIIMEADTLLNPQTGKLVDINIEAGSWETIRAAGQEWQAQRFRLTGEKMNIDLWYGPAGEWLQLRSTLENGRELEYRLIDGPAVPLPAAVVPGDDPDAGQGS